jgi:ankyrin repeat domain-containing protein 50
LTFPNRADFCSSIIVDAVEKYLRTVAEDVRDIHTTLNESRKQLAEIEDSSREWRQQFQELKLSHEQDNIIRWLQYTDPSTNHNAACEKREPLTGNWLLQSDDFTKWKQESKQFLWLHGIPGCGKTILASTVIEHIKSTCKMDSRCQYIFYYFDFNDSKKQEVASLLRSVLAQLASRDLRTLKEIEKLYKQNDRGKQQPDKKSLLSILLLVLRSSSRTYLIIDALDECSQWSEMLKVLSNIYQRCSEEVNILVTSRKEYDIELVLDGLTTSSIGIQRTVVDGDIRIHVKNCLVEDVKLKRWPPAVKKEMEDALVRGAHGM